MSKLPTREEAYQAGRTHRSAGHMLTPHDCIEFDTRLFDAIRGNKSGGSIYADLRGAFNKGFEDEHSALVFAEVAA